MRKIVFIAFIFSIVNSVMGQVALMVPEIASEDSVVTITFDAKQGNRALAGFTGSVYAYTGVITTASTSDGDWKHVVNPWRTVSDKVKMTSLGGDKYSITFLIKDFYGLSVGEKVTKLAFLFVNSTYSIIGRDVNDKDILIPLSHDNTGSLVANGTTGSTYWATTEKGTWYLRFMRENVAKIEYKPLGSTVLDTSFTVSAQPEAVSVSVDNQPTYINYSSSSLTVHMTKSPLKFTFIENGDTVFGDKYGVYSNGTGGGASFKITSDESLVGTGSRAIPVNRRGKVLSVYNQASYGYSNNSWTLNVSVPLVVSSRGYGLFIDNQNPLSLDLGATNPTELGFTAEAGNLRYYFIGGGNYSNVMENYTWLTGRQEMPPMWSLGYIQSKYGYQTETEARAIVNTLRSAKFPVEGLVLDLYWFGTMANMGNLSWNNAQWPTPSAMMSDFKAMNLQTILITEPYFTTSCTNYSTLVNKGYLAKKSDGTPFVLNGFWAGDAGLLDMTNPNAANWMWPFYKARKQEGVGGWWLDLGEPETHPTDMVHQFGSARSIHNIYSLQWAKMLHDNYAKDYANERLFNLIRSGFAGMQRYSTFPWSGDIARSWSGLEAQVPIMLGAGMSGIGYMHSDAGGFTDTGINGEMYTRWIQMAAFSPILRIHGVGDVEPTKHTEPYKSIVRNYINLRYRLLPYNYTLAYEVTSKGLPMARQLDFYDSSNSALRSVNDAYLWGENLLVAPIMQSGATSRSVLFPAGKWIDFNNTANVYSGSATVSASISTLPLFVKAGAFIPMATKYVTNTTKFTTDSIEVAYYPESTVPNSSYTMYCDNGTLRKANELGKNELLTFQGTVNANSVEIALSKSVTTYPEAPTLRNLKFAVKRMNVPTEVRLNGVVVEKVTGESDFKTKVPAWYFNASTNEVVTSLNWNGANSNLVLDGSPITSLKGLKAENGGFSIEMVTPNPVKTEASLFYTISQPAEYTVSIYSSEGVEVFTEQNEISQPGSYVWSLNIASLPQGIYLLKLSNGESFVSTKVLKR